MRLHGPAGAALAEAANFFRIIESFRQGDESFDDVPLAAIVKLGDFSAAGVQVGCHGAEMFFGHHDFQVHDRLQQLGVVLEGLIDGIGAVVHELERRLRVTEPVIKFLTVRTDEELKRIDKIKKIRDSKKKASAAPAATAASVTATPEASTEAPASAPV